MKTAALLVLLSVGSAGCGASVPPPATLDVNQMSCAYCRMIISDHRFASQVASRREEPLFFDDLGCLAHHLESLGGLPPGGIIYVADHRTNNWAPFDRAVFTRVDTISAPMGSHIIAHESVASRDADPQASGGTPIDRGDILTRVSR